MMMQIHSKLQTATVLVCSDGVCIGVFPCLDDVFGYLQHFGEITCCALRDSSGIYDLQVSMYNGVHEYWTQTVSAWTARLYRYASPEHCN